MDFHPTSQIGSWGRIGRRNHAVAKPRFTEEIGLWNASSEATRLAIGNRRSYSDVCLSDGGKIVDMTGMDRFRSFDPASGILVAEAGVTLDSILKAFVPRGFFLPVTPGTRFVTLGGAVANDVHGKNHHRAGTFGCHVQSIALERSDSAPALVTPSSDPQLFAATVGGLGLTGIITEVALKLQPIASSNLDVETIACEGLDALCDEIDAGDRDFEHVVAWIDCTARGANLGRGLLSRANWCAKGPLEVHGESRRSVPTDRLTGLLNPLTLKLFNSSYQQLGRMRAGRGVRNYDGFFYPLDTILHWNRLYGRNGFYQYQCVIPDAAGRAPIRALLAEIAASGEGSFLAVLKRFGDRPSPGLLSFPEPGLTLALDFRNRGTATLDLLGRLDRIVAEASGRLYPAKDLRMPRALFEAGYPALKRFEKHVDPACLSEFWKRVGK
jgi:L-gulonolactone oxidase